MCACPFDPDDPFDDELYFVSDFRNLFGTPSSLRRVRNRIHGRTKFPSSRQHLESPDGLVISLEVPGIARNQIDLTVERNRLTISGSRDFIRESSDEEFVRLERGFGSFKRVFEIPSGIEPNSVTASLDLGVLTIRIPRPPASRNSDRDRRWCWSECRGQIPRRRTWCRRNLP